MTKKRKFTRKQKQAEDPNEQPEAIIENNEFETNEQPKTSFETNDQTIEACRDNVIESGVIIENTEFENNVMENEIYIQHVDENLVERKKLEVQLK